MIAERYPQMECHEDGCPRRTRSYTGLCPRHRQMEVGP